MKKIKGYLNVEQLTQVINRCSYGVACSYYCSNVCQYRNDEDECNKQTFDIGNGTCLYGDDEACRLYAEFVIELADNGFEIL